MIAYIIMGVLTMVCVASLLKKFNRKPAANGSITVRVSSIRRPSELHTIYLVQGTAHLESINRRSKATAEKVKAMWESDKKYFNDMWFRIPVDRRKFFVSTLIDEMCGVMEPYFASNKDTLAILWPSLRVPLFLRENIERGDKDVATFISSAVSGQHSARIEPLVKSFNAGDVNLDGDPNFDTKLCKESEEFLSSLSNLTHLMFLYQLLTRYRSEANRNVTWGVVKRSSAFGIMITGVMALSVAFIIQKLDILSYIQ
jgi:hypothetical protein